MRKVNTTFFILSLLFVSFTSCRKDRSHAVINTSGFNISFKADGVFRNMSGEQDVTAFLFTNKSSLQLIGDINDGKEGISLRIENFTGVGQYTIAPFSSVAAAYHTGSNDPSINSYIGEEGLIVVSSSTEKQIKGTFHFKGKNSVGVHKTITEGRFEAKITTM